MSSTKRREAPNLPGAYKWVGRVLQIGDAGHRGDCWYRLLRGTRTSTFATKKCYAFGR
jgi:hypothetical protein